MNGESRNALATTLIVLPLKWKEVTKNKKANTKQINPKIAGNIPNSPPKLKACKNLK
jgi:hypothetical protein